MGWPRAKRGRYPVSINILICQKKKKKRIKIVHHTTLFCNAISPINIYFLFPIAPQNILFSEWGKISPLAHSSLKISKFFRSPLVEFMFRNGRDRVTTFSIFFVPYWFRDGTRTDAQQQLAVVEYVEAAKLNLTKQRIAGRIVDDDTLFFVSVFNSW